MTNPSKIHVACPSCNYRLRAPAEMAGKRGRCPQCGERFQIPTADVPAPQPAPLPLPAEPEYPEPARRLTAPRQSRTNPTEAAPDELDRYARAEISERGQPPARDDADEDVARKWNAKIRQMKDRKPPPAPRGRRKLLALAGLAILLLAGTGTGAWLVISKRASIPLLGGGTSDDGSLARADEEELVLWYLDSEQHQLARSKLIPRKSIPASNGDPYLTVLVNDFDQGLVMHVADERGPLRDGNEQHEWKLRPNVEGLVKGFDKASWTGELSKEVTTAGARVRFACASSGTTQLTVQLLQIELLQPGVPPKGNTVKTVWEGAGKAQCNTKEWSLVTADLTERASTRQPGRAFVLIIEAAGDNCRIATGLEGKPNVLSAQEEKFKGRFVDIAEGHAVPAGTKCAQAAVFIKKR